MCATLSSYESLWGHSRMNLDGFAPSKLDMEPQKLQKSAMSMWFIYGGAKGERHKERERERERDR